MFLIALITVYPFIFMLSSAFKKTSDVFESFSIIPKEFYFDNIKRLFSDDLFPTWYWNSIWTICLTVLLRVIIVSAAAYAFARLEFKLKNIMFTVFISALIITPDTTIVSRYLIYKYLHLYDTAWSIILPAAADVFFLFLMRQFFMGVPKELSEAAKVDGCGHFRIYAQIMLPLSVPAIVTMVLFTFVWTWNDFVNPFIFISDIKRQLITVGLSYFQGLAGPNIALQMAGASIATIPTLILFVFLQKYFIQGIASSGIKG